MGENLDSCGLVAECVTKVAHCYSYPGYEHVPVGEMLKESCEASFDARTKLCLT
jgi:hypothetical protein